MRFAAPGRGRSPSVHQGNLYPFAIIVTNLCAGFPWVFPRLSTCPPRLSPGLSTANFHVFSGKTDFLHRNADLSTGTGPHPPQGLWKTHFIHRRKLMTELLFLCHQFVTYLTFIRRIFSTKPRRTIHIFPGCAGVFRMQKGLPAQPLCLSRIRRCRESSPAFRSSPSACLRSGCSGGSGRPRAPWSARR